MLLRVMAEPHFGASFDDQLACAQASEELGFDGFFRSDHFLAPGPGGEPGPTDAWVTLGAIAAATERLRLGTLVTAATFRAPAILAAVAAQVDQMSHGRLEVGLGAAWFVEEHRAFGLDFPDAGERFDRLEEQLEILVGLWDTDASEPFSYRGRYYELEDNPRLPRPAQKGGPPIIIGGVGKRRTPELAARFANEFNVPFAPVEKTGEAFERVRDACSSSGRDPESLILSFAIAVALGRDRDQAVDRVRASMQTEEDFETEGIIGTPDELVAVLSEFKRIGAQRAYLQLPDVRDLEHLHLIAEATADLR